MGTKWVDRGRDIFVAPDLLEQLRAQLRRDPTDGQIAFLLSLAVREPFIVYGAERARLRRLLTIQARSAREVLVVAAAEQLLANSATPSRGSRRPDSGSTHVVGGESDPPPPKGPRERETEPLPPKKKR